MSSPQWFEYLQKAFPEWVVEDTSGNNFNITKDFPGLDGQPYAVSIAEVGAAIFMNGGWMCTVDMFKDKEMSVFPEDYGREHTYCLIEVEERWGYNTDRKELCSLFAEETLLTIEGYIHRFRKENLNGWKAP